MIPHGSGFAVPSHTTVYYTIDASVGNNIPLDQSTPTPTSQIQMAFAAWTQGNTQAGGSGTTFALADSAHPASISVVADTDPSQRSAADAAPKSYAPITPGNPATTTIHQATRFQNSSMTVYQSGQPRYNQVYLGVLLHEIGHLMGIDDYNATVHDPGSGPGASVMINGPYNTNDQANPYPQTAPSNCDILQAARTSAAFGGGGSGSGGGSLPPPTKCCAGCCCANPSPDGNVVTSKGAMPNLRCTPLLFDMSGHGFHLTDTDGGVQFDIFANGHPKQIPWVAVDSDNAWLVLDRNGNGTIDDATELFGNLTPQDMSNDPNGFRALAEFDKPQHGGNNDGIIERDDAIYIKLRLWIDRNHNGVSEPSEMVTLTSAGIEAIDLRYREILRKDVNGNVYRYKSRITDTEHRNVRSCYDVLLVTDK